MPVSDLVDFLEEGKRYSTKSTSRFEEKVKNIQGEGRSPLQNVINVLWSEEERVINLHRDPRWTILRILNKGVTLMRTTLTFLMHNTILNT